MARMRRGKKGKPATPPPPPPHISDSTTTADNEQCMYCDLIYKGRLEGTNPKRQVSTIGPDNTLYDRAADGVAAGVPWDAENGFSHGICPECDADLTHAVEEGRKLTREQAKQLYRDTSARLKARGSRKKKDEAS